jgi:hypothetical protein
VENAIEAMGDTGTLRIAAENVVLGPDNPLTLAPGSYVRLSFRDEGPGIATPDLERIFDPYFTRKEMGHEKGTGLSLSICYSIVKEHGGSIIAESGAGQGSTFHIYLPATASEELSGQESSLADGPAAAPPRAGQKKGKLLFMDDDQNVREVIVEMLLHLGYQVEFARDGEEAISHYMHAEKNGQPFDVVIADLTVPHGMGGKALIRSCAFSIRASRP